jgi:hypothetical protein
VRIVGIFVSKSSVNCVNPLLSVSVLFNIFSQFSSVEVSLFKPLIFVISLKFFFLISIDKSKLSKKVFEASAKATVLFLRISALLLIASAIGFRGLSSGIVLVLILL